MKNRTCVDLSKHELIEEISDVAKIWGLKNANSCYQKVNFINIDGVLLVTGDYGRWTFCREFHPGGEGVSDSYWIEKLRYNSEQNPYNFSGELLKKQIDEYVLELIDNNLDDFSSDDCIKKEIQFFREMKDECFDSESEYIEYVKANAPHWIESIPMGQEINIQLLVIFDYFDEICKRIKKNEH